MSGPEHYQKAEGLLLLAHKHQADGHSQPAVICRAEAQVHATLAAAAASAYDEEDRAEWRAATAPSVPRRVALGDDPDGDNS